MPNAGRSPPGSAAVQVSQGGELQAHLQGPADHDETALGLTQL